MNPTRRILQSIDRTIRRWELLKSGQSVLVAFSGGADSTALLEALCLLRRKRSLRIGAAHLDHGLSPLSGRWVRHCAKVAAELGAPYHTHSVDVRQQRSKSGGSLEEAARLARYAFLTDTAVEAGYATIATAHTADDQAETFLMRLFRGAGPAGLGGIPVRRGIDARLCIIRPLLEVRRSDIRAFLKERHRLFLNDPSNKNTDLFRNRIRLKILPFLSRQIGPSVYTRLVGAAQSCSSVSRALQRSRPEGVSSMVACKGPRRIILRGPYRNEEDAYRMAALRLAIAGVAGDLRRITSGHLSALNDLVLNGRSGTRMDLPGLQARVGSSGLVLSRRRYRKANKSLPEKPVGSPSFLDLARPHPYNTQISITGGDA